MAWDGVRSVCLYLHLSLYIYIHNIKPYWAKIEQAEQSMMSWKVNCSMGWRCQHWLPEEGDIWRKHGLRYMNIEKWTFQEVGTASANALTRNVPKGLRNSKWASVAGTESQREITRDEVSEVPKPRPCTFFLAIVRIWVSTLNMTGNPWEGVEWRYHRTTLVTLLKVGCREIIPFLLFLSLQIFFSPSH